jgi:hypothetical protein
MIGAIAKQNRKKFTADGARVSTRFNSRQATTFEIILPLPLYSLKRRERRAPQKTALVISRIDCAAFFRFHLRL